MSETKQKDIEAEASDGILEVIRAGEEISLGENRFYAPATVTAIKIFGLEYKGHLPDFVGLIDTGGFGEAEYISKILRESNVYPGRVVEVYLTHNHPDHAGNVHLFPEARVVAPDSIYSLGKPNTFELVDTLFMREPGVEIKGGIPHFSDRARIVSTPGHTGQDLSILYQSKSGLIAVVGDLFWSEHDWQHDDEYLSLCVNPDLQKISRDYFRKLKPAIVIPGHGPAFAPSY